MKAACTVPDYAYAKYSEREPDPLACSPCPLSPHW